MSNTINTAAAGVSTNLARYDASAAKAAKAPTPPAPSKPDSASVKVDVAASEVAYTASLNTLRTTNKMMMGYLLNIKV